MDESDVVIIDEIMVSPVHEETRNVSRFLFFMRYKTFPSDTSLRSFLMSGEAVIPSFWEQGLAARRERLQDGKG